jgi:cation-transporting ATPase 13A3/4/5
MIENGLLRLLLVFLSASFVAFADHSITPPVPFVVTIVISILVSTYLLLDPTTWVQDLMELTEISRPFKVFLLLLALTGFACSWVAEKHLLPRLAKAIGRAKDRSQSKKRKLYKELQDEMRM